MNKKLLSLFMFGFVLLSGGLVNALTYDDSASNDSMLVKVEVLKSTVSISVPDNLIMENMAPGYLSDEQSFDIINSGTTDIQVIPELFNSTNDEIFSNLVFKRILDDDLVKVGFFDIEIEKPSSVGGTNKQNVYVQLDLTEYDGEYIDGANNATIIFTAVPI